MLGTLGESTDVLLIAQALPCSLAYIQANPNLMTDHTMGILVEKYPVLYNRFDDEVVSGNITLTQNRYYNLNR